MKKKNESQPAPDTISEMPVNDFSEEQLIEEKRAPWLRQPDEPAKYYLLFRIYLDLSLKRTFPMLEKMTGISQRTLKRISAKFNWQRRADAYDIDEYERHHAEITELVGYYNREKIRQKIEISASIQSLVDGLKPYLINFDNFYENPEAVKKLKYFRNVSKMLMDMIKMTDFSVEKIMKDSIVNEIEIANILKGRQDPDFFLRSLPDNLKDNYKKALERLARQDKQAKEEQENSDFHRNNGKSLHDELADLLNEVLAQKDDSFGDINDIEYEEDEESFDYDESVPTVRGIEDAPDFDSMTEQEIENYLSLNPDKKDNPVPLNDPSKFNYESFHAKLVALERRRESYDNWKKLKNSEKECQIGTKSVIKNKKKELGIRK